MNRVIKSEWMLKMMIFFLEKNDEVVYGLIIWLIK